MPSIAARWVKCAGIIGNGVTVRRETEERTGRPVSLGPIYPTMDRLEERGYVTSAMSRPTSSRGGRSRRYFTLEPAGRAVLDRTRTMISAMWEGHEAASEAKP